MNELTEELAALRAILQDIMMLWPDHAVLDIDAMPTLQIAQIVRLAVRADRETIVNRAQIAQVCTLAALALRTVIGDADVQVAMDVQAGVLHAGTARAIFQIIRDVVKPFNEPLAESLATPKTEKAEVRS